MFERRHRLLGDCVATALASSGLAVDRLEPPCAGGDLPALDGYPLVVVDSAVLDGEGAAGSSLREELRDGESSVLVVATDPTHSDEHAGSRADAVIAITDELPTLVSAVHRLLRRAATGLEPEPEPACEPRAAFGDPRVLLASLSPREERVLESMMRGLSAVEIAEARYVSVATVRSQIRSILTKLEVRSQLAAVALAHEAGWNADCLWNSSNLAIRAPQRLS